MSKSKSKRLRELIAKGAVLLPGVPNAAMARQVEQLGFDAVYISGAGMANATAGVPDIGLLTLTEVAQLAGYIAKAVEIPAIVDADTGFGGAENVARTIRELESAGLAGCHIEDQEFPKRCGVGKRRLGRLPHRGPGISKALRPSRREIDCRTRGDGWQNQSCHRCAARSGFHGHRANRCARGRRF